MPKLLTLMFCAAAFLMLLMSSCLSQEQRNLKNEVKSLNETLPHKVEGFTFDNITYNPDTETVTLELVADNTIASFGVSVAPAIAKYALVNYLKSESAYADLVYAIRKANATLVCPCFDENDSEIASFTIAPGELY
ncbi:MAG: hypothetical protein K2M07_08700 [Muribaculaceae bacterium]|nr:hypothetical protein [Muribaculaceae bacterium]